MCDWKNINSVHVHSEIRNLVAANRKIPDYIKRLIKGKDKSEGGYRLGYMLNDSLVLKFNKRTTNNDNEYYEDSIRYALGQSINEGLTYHKLQNLLPLAKCKVFSNDGFIVTLMERTKHVPEEIIPLEVREIFSSEKGILAYDALSQCGMNKQGEIVCYDYGVEDATEFNEEEFLNYLKGLQPLTNQAIREFQESLSLVSSQTAIPQ